MEKCTHLQPGVVAIEKGTFWLPSTTVGNFTNIYLNVCKQITDVKLLLLHRNTWNKLTMCKKMSSGSFKNVIDKIWKDIRLRLEPNLPNYFTHYHYHHQPDNTEFPNPISHHPSLLFTAPGRSSRLHPVSAQSWWSTSICRREHHSWIPTCWMGGRWPYNCCFVGYRM